jgi:multiple sugar transport system ATP-binding protein
MIAGLEDVSSGRIWIGDRITDGVAPKDRNIAMMFQDDALYPHLTVHENMAFGLKLRGIDRAKRDKEVCEAADLLGISPLLDRLPGSLSGGQRRRVAMGRVIVRRPEVFLFDEPTSSLDAGLRSDLRVVVRVLHGRLDTTTICVTHDQEEAMALADRLAVILDGTVQQCASPSEVYDRPVNRFVAGFFGSPPMNFLEGRIVRDGEKRYFDNGDCRVGLSDGCCGALAADMDERIVLGIRPEDLSARANLQTGGSTNSLPVTVGSIERLGQKALAFCETPCRKRVICQLGKHSDIREGQSVMLDLNLERIHFFEPGVAGVNVSLNGNGASISAN